MRAAATELPETKPPLEIALGITLDPKISSGTIRCPCSLYLKKVGMTHGFFALGRQDGVRGLRRQILTIYKKVVRWTDMGSHRNPRAVQEPVTARELVIEILVMSGVILGCFLVFV